MTLPHIAGEWKGPDGSMKEATLQSGYDGAALVYARNQALAHQGKGRSSWSRKHHDLHYEWQPGQFLCALCYRNRRRHA